MRSEQKPSLTLQKMPKRVNLFCTISPDNKYHAEVLLKKLHVNDNTIEYCFQMP